MSELTIDELASELSEFEAPDKPETSRTPREERIIAGFEDIQRFFEEHDRLPRHGEEHDIFERVYAVRLDRLRRLEECRSLLEPLDHQGLLGNQSQTDNIGEDIDDDALLEQLGISDEAEPLTELKHVRPAAEKRAAEEIARRDKCDDFQKFKPLFEQVQQELDTGARETRTFELKAEIRPGAFFIVGGQKAYVADMDEIFTNAQGRTDARLRVIFDNGTESNMLMRSLQRALHNDDAGRRITESEAGPLFTGDPGEGDQESGTIYVLRSNADLPQIRENRSIIHKIGVTGGDLKRRIANAEREATYLLAKVEIVREYKLFNINRTKLEKLLHRIFAPARLDLEIKDRFGNPFRPSEWFLVPLDAIDDTVEKIRDGSITGYRYDSAEARLKLSKGE
jgi:Meiotically Up-regulated Gene 113 (MUG113) protein